MGNKKYTTKTSYNCCITYNGKTIWYETGHPTAEAKEMLSKMRASMKEEIDAVKRRTEEEKAKTENDAHYVCSGQYERDCFVNKTAWGWGSFFIVFLLCLLFFWQDLWVFSVPIALLFALIASLIGIAIASKQNIDNATEHGVPKNHPRLQHDKNDLKMAGIGAIGAAASIGHNAYKAGKEIADVDHWKKMK